MDEARPHKTCRSQKARQGKAKQPEMAQQATGRQEDRQLKRRESLGRRRQGQSVCAQGRAAAAASRSDLGVSVARIV